MVVMAVVVSLVTSSLLVLVLHFAIVVNAGAVVPGDEGLIASKVKFRFKRILNNAFSQ